MPTVRNAPQYLAVAALLAAAQPLASALADDGRTAAASMSAAMSATCSANPTPRSPIRREDLLGRRHLALRRPAGRRADRLRALLSRRAWMLGIELDWILSPTISTTPQVLSYRATATGTASEELEWLASLRGLHRLRHRRMDALRHRRHRLGQHALLAGRPHDRQRGRQPQQHPAGLHAGRRHRLPPDSRWSARRRVSLHSASASAALPSPRRRHATIPCTTCTGPRRLELQVRRGGRVEGKARRTAAPAPSRSRPTGLRLPGLSAFQRAL